MGRPGEATDRSVDRSQNPEENGLGWRDQDRDPLREPWFAVPTLHRVSQVAHAPSSHTWMGSVDIPAVGLADPARTGCSYLHSHLCNKTAAATPGRAGGGGER